MWSGLTRLGFDHLLDLDLTIEIDSMAAWLAAQLGGGTGG